MRRSIWWACLAGVGLLLAGCGPLSPTVGVRPPGLPVSGATVSAAAAPLAPAGRCWCPPLGTSAGSIPRAATLRTGSIPTRLARRARCRPTSPRPYRLDDLPTGRPRTVRGSRGRTGKVKKAAMLAYGLPVSGSKTTELDHFVPLELGGANDVRNLWPEPSDEPGHGVENTKDQVENDLNAAVCRGQVPLTAAQQAIAADWTTAEQRLGLPSP